MIKTLKCEFEKTKGRQWAISVRYMENCKQLFGGVGKI